MKRLIVCFTDECFKGLKQYDSYESIFLTFVPIHTKLSKIIYVNSIKEPVFDLEIKKWMEIIAQSNKLPFLRGYSNTVYENCLLPFVTGISIFKKLINSAEQKFIEVRFYKITLLKCRSLPFYMAEGETQGVRWYCRRQSYIPYFKDIACQHSIRVKYEKIELGFSMYYNNFIRLGAVYLGRELIDCTRALAFRKRSPDDYSKLHGCEIEYVLVARTKQQLELLTSFAEKLRGNVLILVGSTYQDAGRAQIYLRKQLSSNITFKSLKFLDKSSVIYFFKFFFKILFAKSSHIYFYQTKLKTQQIVREMLALSKDAYKYQRILSDSLKEHLSYFSSSPCFITLEQKGIYASVDALVAAKFGMKCFQLVTVSQTIRRLPFPVWGDVLCLPTKESRDNWRLKHPEVSPRFNFLPSIRSLGIPIKSNDKIFGSMHLCIFGSTEVQENERLCNYVASNVVYDQISFKKHPRDLNTYRNRLSQIVVPDYMSRFELLDRVDMAVVLPSAVINDLILANIPFIVYFPPQFDIGANDMLGAEWWFPEYFGNVWSLEDIARVSTQKKLLVKSFYEIRSSYINKLGDESKDLALYFKSFPSANAKVNTAGSGNSDM